MRGPGSALKKGYKTTLTGITLGAQTIPVFNDKVEGTPSIYILITVSTMNNISGKQIFVHEVDQDIELHHMTNSTAQSEVLERLEDESLQRLIPSPGTVGVTIEDPFKLIDVVLVSSSINEVQQMENKKYLHAKRVTFKNIIAQ